MTRRSRAVVWIVLVAIACAQAYAQRYAVGPDGMSYLDLSDGVVTGRWSRLVNLYWSPLYPALIGVARVLARATPAREVTLVHGLNVLCFVAALAAFQYFIKSVLELLYHKSLAQAIEIAGYALFAAFVFTMAPLELTTPDLLVAAAVFVVFGALLRLRARPHALAPAAAFGIALGLGALAKSFMVPWGIVCFVTLVVAVRRNGLRALAVAAATWLLFVVPWTATLSHAAGRLTFGDAGRLTYVWYVNGRDAPSLNGVPPDARTPRTDAILPGTALVADTSATDPMWFDPARWNASLRPRFNLRDQWETLQVFGLFYVSNLAPLLFLFTFILLAGGEAARESWRRAWPILIPVLAGLGAYAAIIVAARYIMPFLLAGTLAILATIPPPTRVSPRRVLIAFGVVALAEGLSASTLAGLRLVAAVTAAVLCATLLARKTSTLRTLALLVVLGVVWLVLPPAFPDLLRVAAAALVILLWRVAIAARDDTDAVFARTLNTSLAVAVGALFVVRLGTRAIHDVSGWSNSAENGNVAASIAADLASHGVTAGERIAVIGPHADSYWARVGRLHIVASVPRRYADDFWKLPVTSQDALLREFAAGGATVAIASVGPTAGQPDPRWIPVKFRGWIRPLR